ncbi:MAG: hypothetical protein IK118_09885 [Clostridia bacterium]|nr:hypothetical protein [Clostridia bacterium]
MATCPNCDYKLKLTDWRPECPKCGVNLMYFKMEERLRADADKAELEYAKGQPRIDRLKASVFGSPWAIVRLVMLLLPIGALMLPLGRISLNLPFYEKTTTVNAVEIYNAVSKMDFGRLFSLAGSDLIGKDVTLFLVSLVLILLTLVVIIVQLVFVVMSFGKKGYQRNVATAAIGAVLTLLSGLFFALSCKGFGAHLPGVFTGSLNPLGMCAVAITFLLIIAINLLIKMKGIEVKYKDVSEFLLPYNERPSVIAAKKEEEMKEEIKEEI